MPIVMVVSADGQLPHAPCSRWIHAHQQNSHSFRHDKNTSAAATAHCRLTLFTAPFGSPMASRHNVQQPAIEGCTASTTDCDADLQA